eukprot:TRINITY_DN3325_c0_g2_i1.p1 TRINITY_DN3325_c0_g2~~TRINITY_DN3325_c0_g2_i1.p1  ORF type:complete len:164 (-),score=11.25 TRINITY_DN3325_c0_g2_i1:18-509(-)
MFGQTLRAWLVLALCSWAKVGGGPFADVTLENELAVFSFASAEDGFGIIQIESLLERYSFMIPDREGKSVLWEAAVATETVEYQIRNNFASSQNSYSYDPVHNAVTFEWQLQENQIITMISITFRLPLRSSTLTISNVTIQSNKPLAVYSLSLIHISEPTRPY